MKTLSSMEKLEAKMDCLNKAMGLINDLWEGKLRKMDQKLDFIIENLKVSNP